MKHVLDKLKINGFSFPSEIYNLIENLFNFAEKNSGSGGIRTHASEETGALNQRLRPLGHATLQCFPMALVKAAFLRKGGFGQTVIPG